MKQSFQGMREVQKPASHNERYTHPTNYSTFQAFTPARRGCQ